MGFSSDGATYERPRNYTPKLSALIYCVRLCLCEYTLPRFEHPSIGWTVRPSQGQLERLNSVRERFMCNGCQAPMGELLSLRSYGRALSRSDGPSFRVSWSEDSQTVSWDAGEDIGRLTMEELRDLGAAAVSSATDSLDRLMYGLKPSIDLSQLRDRLSNSTHGYSFVKDPANKLSTAYLELSSRACLDPIDGLMASERWNMIAVRRYLKEEVHLLTHLMLIIFLRSGQSPRSTELFSIEHRNGSSTSRGLGVHDGLMVAIIQHWKARQNTNQEFNVARYLPLQDSLLLAKYLIYVRPFTDMLCRVCLHQDTDRRLFFASPENPGQCWKVGILTKALKSLTKNVCGVSFGAQVYRQLSIAVTEKHVKQISKPFNRYDDKSSNADLDVVFSWQSGHRPLQRGTTYGIDGAFPDSLQPALLRIYRWASLEWHTFLKADVPRPGKSMAARGRLQDPARRSVKRRDETHRKPSPDKIIPKKRRLSTHMVEKNLSATPIEILEEDMQHTDTPAPATSMAKGKCRSAPLPGKLKAPKPAESVRNTCKQSYRKAPVAPESEIEGVVQDSGHDASQPWLVVTGWARYLQGFHCNQLLSSIQSPPDGSKTQEHFESVIWKAITNVAWISQHTVSISDLNFRAEANRTELGQSQPSPLDACLDRGVVEGLIHPWRQILMFFVRTQKEHTWESPSYKFTKRQFMMFEKLIHQASYAVNGTGDTAESNDMTPLETACLNFCIELLNQEIMWDDYDSAFLCALAILSIDGPGRWKHPQAYKPLISNIITSARSLMVQKAANMALSRSRKDQYVQVSQYGSDGRCRLTSSSQLRQLEAVKLMVNSFVVAGTRSPIQWMLHVMRQF